MEEPLLAALRAVRDQITRLRVVEAGILNLLEGEPMPEPRPQIPASGENHEPAPEPKPKRPYRVIASGSGRPAGPLRGWVADLIDARGPLSVPEILDLKPELHKQQVYNLVSSCPWFERVPDLIPATYGLSAIGREEYAKAKAEEKPHDPVA